MEDDKVKCPNCGYQWSPERTEAFDEEDNDPQTDFIEFEAMGESGLADVALAGTYPSRRNDSGKVCPKCHHRID